MSSEQQSQTSATADSVLRAITDDGAFRVIAARTTATVRGAVAAQKARGIAAKHFSELITGAILIREAMAPRLRVQAILKPSGAGNLIADSHPDGTSRGLVHFGAGTEGGAESDLSIAQGALLQVMRTLPSGAIHQGVVAVPEDSGVSGALMAYMQESEQIVTMISVSALRDDDGISAAGGYLIQLLPEVERGPLMVMTERLADFAKLDDLLRGGGSPDALLAELLYGMPHTRLEESPLAFGCPCSHLRVVSSLATLPRADIEDLTRSGDVLEISCEYCGKDYQIHAEQLTSLLTPS